MPKEIIKGNLVFKNYVNLSASELVEILAIRNDEKIRKWMFNNEMIQLSHHFEFIDFLKKSNEKYYWAVFKKEKIVGATYLTISKEVIKTCEWGFFIAPQWIGTGLGLEIEFEFLNVMFFDLEFDNVCGWIKKDNRDSIPIQKLFGFKEIKIETDFIVFHLDKGTWRQTMVTDFKSFKKKLAQKWTK